MKLRILTGMLVLGLGAGVGQAAKKPRTTGGKPNPLVDPNNVPPPVGAILDLNGTPIPGGGNHTFQTYSITFVANVTSTAITFAFREDPDFLYLEQVSVVDQTVPGPNLLTNGDFSGGTYTSSGNNATPNGWIYANQYGADAGGVVRTSGCGGATPNNCFYDGAVQAYDAISQTITTVVGHTYKIQFSLADDSSCGACNFSRLSTNGDTTSTGGNGKDLLVYAQAGLPAPSGPPAPPIAGTPIPNTLILMLIAIAAAFVWYQYSARTRSYRNF
jgi:hypothetical protein